MSHNTNIAGKNRWGSHTLNGYSFHELRIIQDEVPDYENHNPYLVANGLPAPKTAGRQVAHAVPLYEALGSGRARVFYEYEEVPAPQRNEEYGVIVEQQPVRMVREIYPLGHVAEKTTKGRSRGRKCPKEENWDTESKVIESKSGHYNSIGTFKEWLNTIAPQSSVDAEIQQREARRERKSKALARRRLDEGEAKRLKTGNDGEWEQFY